MWQYLSLVLALSCSLVDSRVTFATSEVLDTVDLLGVKTAPFRCYAGCRVYSPTPTDKIVIVDSIGNEYPSLKDLSTMKMGESYELPANPSSYQLKKKDNAYPKFVFYAVEKGAFNYFTQVGYVNPGTRWTIDSDNLYGMFTFMSQSGKVHFSNFQGDFTGALPAVYATPFDSVGFCRPVYTASAAFSPSWTEFSVLSPIATIDFKRPGAKSVVVSGDDGGRPRGEGTSAVYVSPGYVGCNSTGTSLYSLLPDIYYLNDSFTVKHPSGLRTTVNGDYSIMNKDIPLHVEINDKVEPMTGKGSISKTYTGTSFKFSISTDFIGGSKDGFAMQVDVADEFLSS